MRTVIVLHESGIAVVEVDHTVSDEILLIMEMNLLGRDAYTEIS
jgi:hypothetical protein